MGKFEQEAKDLLQAIDGRGTIDEVSERIFAVLDGLNN